MHSPLISIAVPIYNTARYLPAALDSLLAQDYPHWEGLLWDDGSSDGSGQIAADYAARDARFRVLGDGANHGAAQALARSLQHARGEFVASLDSDDVLEPQALTLMLAFMQAQPKLGMAYSQYREMDSAGHLAGLGRRCLTPYSRWQLLVELMTFQFRLIRRDAYLAVGGFNPMAAYAEDYDLCLRLSECFPIAQLPQPLYRYRVHTDATSRGSRLPQMRASFDAAHRAVLRRGLAEQHVLLLGVRARHVLKPKGSAAGAAEVAVVLHEDVRDDIARLPQPMPLRFIQPPLADVAGWEAAIEVRYQAFAEALRRSSLAAHFDPALCIDSWHVLQPRHAQ